MWDNDLCLCINKTCTLRDNCYRAQAEPSGMQIYGEFSQEENGECFDQIPLNGKRYEPRNNT